MVFDGWKVVVGSGESEDGSRKSEDGGWNLEEASNEVHG